MNRRKLLTRHEEYLRSIEDSPEEERNSASFYSQLRSYYKRRWGVNLQLPRVNGVEINLFKLYQAVKALGGWCKVTNTDKWYDVAKDVLGLGDEITSADFCARLAYMRYLAKYEQFEQGVDTDDHDNEMMGARNRIRGYSLYVTSECPIPQPRRGEQYEDQPQYDRLIKSLASGLPNEVDFALNICAILSAPGPFIFDLERTPSLITMIVAQAGVFDDNSEFLQEDFIRTQKRTTKRDFGHFWSVSGIEDEDILKFFSMIRPNKYSKLDYELFPQLLNEDQDPKKIGTVEFRVKQVLDIVRNLSFDSHSQPILAGNWACLKFLVICTSTEIYELRNSALDALSELASQICLSTDVLTSILLKLLRSFLFSEDRILVMRAAEIIGGLCVNPENESIMSDFLESDILQRLFELISAKDVLICVNTLNSLYNISEAGKTFCERLAAVQRGVELLVNFCTIEASQFTTNGLYGIKVIEYQTGYDHGSNHQARPSTSYYHPQQPLHSRTLPTPLQPVPVSSSVPRPHVVVSSKGDIASVAANKPALAAQLARPVISVVSNTQSNDFSKREASSALNGSQMKQIRFVNGNGELVIIQQATTSVIEGGAKEKSLDTQQSSTNDVLEDETPAADETTSTIDEGEEDEEMEAGGSSTNQSTSNVDSIKTAVVVAVEEDLVQFEATTVAKSSPSISENEEEERLPAQNGSDHPNGSDEHLVLNGVGKEGDHDEATVEELNENGPLLNGTLPSNHVNGCIKPTREEESEEKPLLNGLIKKTKSKAKKRSAPPPQDSDKSPDLKKHKATPKKKAQKNGYIERRESEKSLAPTSIQQTYARVPQFMCEWDACTNFFHSGTAMIYHVLHSHINRKEGESSIEQAPSTSNQSTSSIDLLYCRWPGCERTPRSRWSLITHLQENHCNENALNSATRKRREIGDSNYVAAIRQKLQEVTSTINHPGYTKFAAYDAIRRHAFNFMPRDITEEHQEGPVTKDLRLTSALILRNMAKNSAECRRRLRPHEGFISYIAMSRLENGTALAQCLAALNPVDV